MQQVVARQPAIAHAVGCLPLYDQLELTLELLRQVLTGPTSSSLKNCRRT